jgi:hypothetical protein
MHDAGMPREIAKLRLRLFGGAWLLQQGLLHTFVNSIIVFFSGDIITLRVEKLVGCAIAFYERG